MFTSTARRCIQYRTTSSWMPFSLLDYSILIVSANIVCITVSLIMLGGLTRCIPTSTTMAVPFLTWQYDFEESPLFQKEGDVLEMALQVSDISLFEDDVASIREEDGEWNGMRLDMVEVQGKKESNRLRTNIATVSQILDLEDKEFDWLAQHMGHDIKFHHDDYRLHESTIEFTEVSKILAIVDKGSISKWVGKPLDKVTVTVNVTARNATLGKQPKM
ncbi:hypothetical protein ACROYT_G014046 [Oculina patagonica]